MRVLIFFDLPVETADDRKEYRRFRKFLIKKGFLMLQYSIYSKLTLNQTAAKLVVESIRKNKPKSGNVMAMVITEKQYSKIEYICGEKSTSIIDTDERLIVL